jgi:hypothetical protein
VGEVDQNGKQVTAGEDRPLGGHRGGGSVEDAGAERGGEHGGAGPAEGLVEGGGGEAVGAGALSPLGEQVGFVGCGLGGAGGGDDRLQLVEGACPAERVFEFADGVVDLAAALAELVQHRIGDAGDLPAAVPGGPPGDPQP